VWRTVKFEVRTPTSPTMSPRFPSGIEFEFFKKIIIE
jgi:hypothetical protein